MTTLILLARNTTNKEQHRIELELGGREDTWAPSGRILAKSAPAKIEGASTIVPLDVFDEPTKTLGDVARLARGVAERHGLTAFDVQLKAFGDVPFHARAIRDRMSKKKEFTSNPESVIYVEAKPAEGAILIRMGVICKEGRADAGAVLVLEHPTTWHEAADFIRLGIALGVEVRFVTLGDRLSMNAIDEAKQVARGWRKARITVVESVDEALGQQNIGFSLWGTADESALKSLKPPLVFLFGNEEKGLSLETKRKCSQVIRLGPKSSEPLRSSQAAAYALGALTALK
jgi:tRNA(Leu) C34 or U34 (ribose-2'-O)-methylase TrmL